MHTPIQAIRTIQYLVDQLVVRDGGSARAEAILDLDLEPEATIAHMKAALEPAPPEPTPVAREVAVPVEQPQAPQGGQARLARARAALKAAHAKTASPRFTGTATVTALVCDDGTVFIPSSSDPALNYEIRVTDGVAWGCICEHCLDHGDCKHHDAAQEAWAEHLRTGEARIQVELVPRRKPRKGTKVQAARDAMARWVAPFSLSCDFAVGVVA